MLRLTPVVKNLIIINVIIFIAQQLAPKMEFASCFGNYNSGYPQDVITGFLAMWKVNTPCFKPFQLFTYMFIHGDFMHIFFNMLALTFMGPILEEFWGTKKFLLFYMITGIGAGIFNIIIDRLLGVGGFSVMMGASGAVYGILTGFGLTFPNMEMRLLIPPISIKAKYMVFILGAIAIVMGFSNKAGDNTAHFAHLGGIVVAMIVIQVWKSTGRN